MKLSEQWLREWVNPPVKTAQLVEQLTMAGLEVDSVTPVAGEFSKVVIGKVLTAEQHPNAERLRVCHVDVGAKELLTIVCGGANVRANLKVAVVLVGGEIKGQSIQSVKLRGIDSYGMICSATELGLQETSQGILELPEAAPIGKNLRNWLKLNDQAIDLHITPNRGDCLSVAGVAREVAVLNNKSFKSPLYAPAVVTIKDKLTVKVHNPQDCPRYLGRIIRNINPQASTPIWMSERLRRSGLRNIHPVVDITNYVLLELGQPLHAFDLEKLSGGIHIRRAKADEEITLLDEQEVSLDSNVLVVADDQKPQAIAGIMGGLHSAVGLNTTAIFLESAFFNPLVIAGRPRCFGINTDSAYRFERGVDPILALKAIHRATQLLLETVGGKAGPITEVTQKKHLPKPSVVKLRKKKLQRVLGVNIPDNTVKNILQRLGMSIKKIKEGWQVTAPTQRFDINIEADLIEEIARIYGFNKIPTDRPHASLTFLALPEEQLPLARLRKLLIDRGYHEAITYSFVSPKIQQLINPEEPALDLINPLSAELAVMRTSLWSGLLNSVRYNQNRQQTRVRLFEMGACFLSKGNSQVDQSPMLAGVVTGNVCPEQWGEAKKIIDFYDVKADLESLFLLTGSPHEFSFEKTEHPALHPGQSAAIQRNGQKIGYVGALHPALIKKLDLIEPVYCFELQLDALCKTIIPIAKSIPKFPFIRRDISFWVNREISAQQILESVRRIVGQLLLEVFVFDVYQEKNNSGLCSMAIGLLLQDSERTLVDEDANYLVTKVIETLQRNFSIQLRK